MSCNTSKSHHFARKKFGSSSTCASLEISIEQQLQTYTNHNGVTWVGKKKDFVNVPIYSYKSLGSVRHIMIGKPRQLSTYNTTIEQHK